MLSVKIYKWNKLLLNLAFALIHLVLCESVIVFTKVNIKSTFFYTLYYVVYECVLLLDIYIATYIRAVHIIFN